ncbi:MAG: right-handed parallel beta-helix repeat-containing protein [Prolixibacteraceae bacterium]
MLTQRKIMVLLIFLNLIIACNSATVDLKIFVSPSGNDSNSGSITSPLQTIDAAKRMIREQRKKFKHGASINVFMREGTYSLDQCIVFTNEDSGKSDAPITYQSYNNEEVRITGSIQIANAEAKKVIDQNIIEKIIDKNAVSKIRVIDLHESGIKQLGTMTTRGFRRPYVNPALEIFINDVPLFLSRWPNDSTVLIGDVIDKGSIPRNNDLSNRGGKFKYNYNRPELWKDASDIWLNGLFGNGYADDQLKVKSIDTIHKVIELEQPHMYGIASGHPFLHYYALNLLEEIDQPGEYYIDRENGKFYFYPPGELKNAKITISILDDPLISFEDASYIHFNNAIFEEGRGLGIYIEKGEGIQINNCIIRNFGTVGVCIGKGIAPYKEYRHPGKEFSHLEHEKIARALGSYHEYLYEHSTFNREAGTNHTIENCHIYNTGAGGICLGGGDRKKLISGNNAVINCRIHDFNRLDKSYKSGINIDGVGNRIEHCEIYNCPNSAIYLHGNNHLIAYNEIHHVCLNADDMGAFYMGRDPSELGNQILYNFWHHIGNGENMTIAIYHDDGACGTTVTGNVFFKAGTRTAKIGGGSDNSYENNIFINCPLAFHLDNRLQHWSKKVLAQGGLFEWRLNEVNYKSPPYSEQYLLLSSYWEDQPAIPKRNSIRNNLIYKVKRLDNWEEKWQEGIEMQSSKDAKQMKVNKPDWGDLASDNFITDTPPGFIDEDNMNFELKKSSEVFKILPAFTAIPFKKIGLKNNNN